MDHEESEEERQAEQGPIEPPERSPGQKEGGRAHLDSESERHAFAVLERFSGELEEILHSLERARSARAPGESTSPPPPQEPPYRPSSIRFERGPISTRVDFSSLPPLPKPQSPSHTGVRLVFESSFLILVAAISALAELRPLLIAAAETAAFLIVALVEFAVARDRRFAQFGQILVSPPASEHLRTGEQIEADEAAQLTIDEIEPLVWKAEKQELETPEPEVSNEPESAAKANWALAPVEPEVEPTEEETVPVASPEEAVASTAESYSVPAVPLQEQGESTALTRVEPATPTAQENVSATELEAAETPVRKHRLFSRREHGESAGLGGETRVEPETEPEVALEHTVDIPAPPEPAGEVEPEPEPEVEDEVEPKEREHRRWFGARRSEPAEGPKPEPEVEPELREHRRWFGTRVSEPAEVPEAEPDTVLEHAVEIPASPESTSEGEPEPEER
ncbi:MAG: hypothetical protein ABSC51_05375, partial [Gaiellaceae bacterium]